MNRLTEWCQIIAVFILGVVILPTFIIGAFAVLLIPTIVICIVVFGWTAVELARQRWSK